MDASRRAHADPAAGQTTEPFTAASLDQPIESRAVDLGAQAAKKLREIGLKTYRDVLYHLPRRYEDRRALPDFGALVEGENATVTGTLMSRAGSRSKRGLHVMRGRVEDGRGGRLTAVWFNQPWLEKQVYPGLRLVLTGRVKRAGSQAELHVTAHEVDDDSGGSLSFNRIVGIYPSVQGLSQAYLRRATQRLLEAVGAIPDHLPLSWLERFDLVPLDQAWRQAHQPDGEAELQRALRRLKFDDFLFFELALLRSRDPNKLGRAFTVRAADLDEFREVLPFTLTEQQEAALLEILTDMAAPKQMARLLQGDVGSGKTAVAAAAIMVAARDGAQAALMAPTEILARQHYANLQRYLFPLGLRCELLIGALGAADRRAALGRLASGEVDLAVGTHALIQDGVAFKDLGLAVIDEEHRFGVQQRRALIQGTCDVLVMSATPIPRSLALTSYGDLDLTTITGLPPGRRPIKSRLVNAARRREVYDFAWRQIEQGRQVYVVTALIEESEALDEVLAATGLVEDLRGLLPGSGRIGLLHGRLSAADKEEVMADFRAHRLDLLVSTTVIEVGVDVPNASVMVIENAERFGLSQLHQLRGRVGRGPYESHCILVAGERSRSTQRRLEFVAKNSDGFAIAEFDLRLRGPGDLRGTRQAGLPELNIGDLVEDVHIIEEARALAQQILAADPDLDARWAGRLRHELRRRGQAVMVREVI